MRVLLLHPLPLDARAWDDVRGLLDHEVVAPTLYGLGTSIEEWATAIVSSLTDGSPFVVVGNSIGGSCAIEIARLAPERVRHLVLMGTKAGHRPEPAFRDEAVRVLRQEGVTDAWRIYWERLIGPLATAEMRSRVARLAHEQSVDDLVRGVLAFHGREDRSSFLSCWAGPVTMVSGEHDLAPQGSKETAQALTRGRFVQLPGVGHYGPMESPRATADLIQQAVRAAALLEQQRKGA